MRFARHIAAILALPVIVVVVIPAAIFWPTGATDIGWSWTSPLTLIPMIFGGLLIVAGLTLLANTVLLFATLGKGTLAPWNPPTTLVLAGPYRYVRNPMISGVLGILLGESILFGSWPAFLWFALFAAGNHIYFVRSEEPGLIRRFGDEYLLYMKHVPRWIPRTSPWDAGQRDAEGQQQ